MSVCLGAGAVAGRRRCRAPPLCAIGSLAASVGELWLGAGAPAGCAGGRRRCVRLGACVLKPLQGAAAGCRCCVRLGELLG